MPDQKPTLVIIGGISNRGGIDSIRKVIRQIKAESDVDILLMTGAFGSVDPRNDRQWQKISDPNHFSEYRKDLDWFKRDQIHANQHGEQILGHILEIYFTLPVSKAKTD